MNDDDHIGVSMAKRAYVRGNIDLATLEVALEDRLIGSSHSHDERIDGHIPSSCRGSDYDGRAY